LSSAVDLIGIATGRDISIDLANEGVDQNLCGTRTLETVSDIKVTHSSCCGRAAMSREPHAVQCLQVELIRGLARHKLHG
jgi:hypothetical protein